MVSGSPPIGGGSRSDTDPTSPVTYTDIFYQHLPFYLSVGMTYDQYWDGDSSMVKYYRSAYELQRERRNQDLWLQGMYIYEALCDVSPILHAFSKKGTKPFPFSEQPYAITQAEHDRRKREKEKLDYDKMKEKASNFAIKFNANFGKRG